MNNVDLRLLEADARLLDEERQRRVQVQQKLNAAKAMDAQLKRRLATRDQVAPPPPPVDRSPANQASRMTVTAPAEVGPLPQR